MSSLQASQSLPCWENMSKYPWPYRHIKIVKNSSRGYQNLIKSHLSNSKRLREMKSLLYLSPQTFSYSFVDSSMVVIIQELYIISLVMGLGGEGK